MASSFKFLVRKLLNLFPLLLLFYFCLSEFDTDFRFFKVLGFNFQFMLIYYWILRKPELLSYGFIFFAGLVNDVIIGLPLGLSSVTYLVVSGFAAYVRNVSVTQNLVANWLSFGPTIVITNLIYVIIIIFITEIELDYIHLLYNSIFTFLFFPVAWFIFEIYRIATRENIHL